MNSGDALQIALRHTGELVKEAAEKDNGSFSLHCLLKGPDKKEKKNALRIDMHPTQWALVLYVRLHLPKRQSYGPVATDNMFFFSP